MSILSKEVEEGLGILRIEHIGVATSTAEDHPLSALLGRPVYKTENVDSESVETHFYRVGQSKIELLTPMDEDSTIAKYIDRRGAGIHHIAFEVEDIAVAFERAQAMGYHVLNEAPKRGADGKMIFFLHPKSTGGILVELCQSV